MMEGVPINCRKANSSVLHTLKQSEKTLKVYSILPNQHSLSIHSFMRRSFIAYSKMSVNIKLAKSTILPKFNNNNITITIFMELCCSWTFLKLKYVWNGCRRKINILVVIFSLWSNRNQFCRSITYKSSYIHTNVGLDNNALISLILPHIWSVSVASKLLAYAKTSV